MAEAATEVVEEGVAIGMKQTMAAKEELHMEIEYMVVTALTLQAGITLALAEEDTAAVGQDMVLVEDTAVEDMVEVVESDDLTEIWTEVVEDMEIQNVVDTATLV